MCREWFLSSVFFAGVALLGGYDDPGPPISVPAEVVVKPGRIARITATTQGKVVRWFEPSGECDIIPLGDGKTVLFVSPTPGTFKVYAYTAKGDVPSEPAVCVVKVGTPQPPKPPIPPEPDPDLESRVKAICRISSGNVGCSATIVGPRRADGRWWVHSAAHCVKGPGQQWSLYLQDGRRITATVRGVDRTADCSWMVTDTTDAVYPHTFLFSGHPAAGTKVLHQGYGIDRPGNREFGTVTGGPTPDNQTVFRLSVSSGDSGGGILHAVTGELISSVCCTSRLSGTGTVYGCTPDAARQLLARLATAEFVEVMGTGGHTIPRDTVHPIITDGKFPELP